MTEPTAAEDAQRRLAWFTDSELAAEIARRTTASPQKRQAQLQADAIIDALRPRGVVLVHHGHPDAHAASWSEGWDEAHRQGVGGAELREWAVCQLAAELASGWGIDPDEVGELPERLADAVLAEPDLSAASCTHLLTEHSRVPGVGCLVYLSPVVEGEGLHLCPCTHPGTSDADQ